VVRRGWPLAQCTVLDSKLSTRYCCETSCETSSCSNAPFGSPQCSSLVAQLNSGYSPSACAANSSACPPGIGSTCDGGCVAILDLDLRPINFTRPDIAVVGDAAIPALIVNCGKSRDQAGWFHLFLTASLAAVFASRAPRTAPRSRT
jgi:hypothetical protein